MHPETPSSFKSNAPASSNSDGKSAQSNDGKSSKGGKSKKSKGKKGQGKGSWSSESSTSSGKVTTTVCRVVVAKCKPTELLVDWIMDTGSSLDVVPTVFDQMFNSRDGRNPLNKNINRALSNSD